MSVVVSKSEFIKILGGLARRWCISETYEAEIKAIGINFSHWPECPPKDLMKEFEFFRETKGRLFSYSMLADRYLAFDDSMLPDPLYTLKDFYLANMKHFRALELAEYISKNTAAVDTLVQDFINNKVSTVEMTEFTSFEETLRHLEEQRKAGTAVVSIPGFEKLSSAIGGFNPGRITLVGANSGFGKTKLAINLALSATKAMDVIFFNMEMMFHDFASQMLQRVAGLTQRQIQRGDYANEGALNKILDYSKQDRKKFIVSDGKSITLDEIVSKIYELTQKHEQTLIIVDYDQKIISNSKAEEWKAMLDTFVSLEDCAKRTKSHILILYQADDSGDVKASKRAKQPASAVLAFYEESSRYFIRSIKNRFNERFTLEVSYDAAATTVKELDFFKEDTRTLLEQRKK